MQNNSIIVCIINIIMYICPIIIHLKITIMRTQINCSSRLEVLNTIKKLEKYNIAYIENEHGILADITQERAFNISLI